MKHFFFLLLVLGLSSAFEQGPASGPAASPEEKLAAASPLGGAYLMFAGKHGGEVTRQEIETHRELKVDGCAWQAKVIRYSLSVTKGGQVSTYQAQSHLLTPEIITKLKSLAKGDSFEFSQVKANMPNGKDTVDVHTKKFIVV